MSLILDALKRAENERREILSPFGAPAAARTDAKVPGGRRGWIAAAVVLLAVGVGAGAYLLKSNKAVHADTANTAPASIVPPPKAPVANATPRPQAAPALSVIPGTEGMASLDELTLAEAIPPPAALPVPSINPARQPVTAAKPAPGNSAIEAEAAAEEPAQESPAPVARPSKPMPAALAQPAPLRKFREMTPEYRADFPAITVEVHVYNDSPSRRWTMINGRRYKDGERLAEGPTLTEIVPDGLVLEYRGEKLLYPIIR